MSVHGAWRVRFDLATGKQLEIDVDSQSRGYALIDLCEDAMRKGEPVKLGNGCVVNPAHVVWAELVPDKAGADWKSSRIVG